MVFWLIKDWRSKLNQRLSGFGINASAMGTLCFLVDYPEGIAQGKLADLLGIEGPTMARLLDRMERQGWVTREVSPNDRRSKTVKVADQAMARIQEVFKVTMGMEQKLMEAASAEELGATVRLFQRLLARLEQI